MSLPPPRVPGMEEELEAALPSSILELSPRPLVALHGLAEMHASVSAKLLLLRTANLESLPPPSQKPRRQTFDDVRPGGILKAGWLSKHALLKPAVIATFVQWAPSADGMGLEEASAVIQAALMAITQWAGEGHNLRVVVVMVVVGDVPSDVEHRLDIVRRRVGLDARNSGLLLPGHEGTLAASADVLQALLFELAMEHHTDACRRARHVHEHLSRPQQSELIIRQSFKFAFHSSFQKDSASSARNYSVAYSELWDFATAGGAHSPLNKSRHSEVKAVAELINHCILKHNFESGGLREAKQQIRRHIKCFRSLRGRDDALFQHHAWIARQHYSFARLAASETSPAASAVAIGGPLSQQHSASSLSAMINPGPYLEDAALAMAQRRLCLQSKGGVDPPPLAPGGTGPRHWGQPEGGGGGSTEEDVARAKVKERSFDHLASEIGILECAEAYFTMNKLPRRAEHAASLRAKVLFDHGKYAQSRDAVVPVIKSLEEAGWAAPAAELQCLLVECCRALKDIGGFVDASIGICRPWSVAPHTHKVRAQEDLALIVTGFPLELPAFSPLRLPPHSSSTHDLSWAALSSPVTLDAPLHGVGITCVGGFSKPSHSTGEELTLHLSLSSMMPCAFKAACLELAFSDARFDKTLGEDDAEMLMSSERPCKISVPLTASVTSPEIRLTSVYAVMGTPPACIRLPCALGEARGKLCGHTEVNRGYSEAGLTIEREARGLVGDLHMMRVLVESLGPHPLKDVKVFVEGSVSAVGPDGSVDTSKGGVLEVWGGVGVGGGKGKIIAGGEVAAGKGSVASGGKEAVEVWIVAKGEGGGGGLRASVRVRAEYSTEQGGNSSCEESFEIDFAPPFSLTASYLSLSPDVLPPPSRASPPCTSPPALIAGESALLKLELRSLTASSLHVSRVVLKTPTDAGPAFELLDPQEGGGVAKDVASKLGGGGVHAVMFMIKAVSKAGTHSCPGEAVVEWGEGGGGGQAVLKLPPVEVGGGGLGVQLSAPTQGFRGGAMGVTLSISNMTAAYQEVLVDVGSSESFLCAGYRQASIPILPSSIQRLGYNFVPVGVGHLELPPIKLKWKEAGKDMAVSVPTSKIFVMPPAVES